MKFINNTQNKNKMTNIQLEVNYDRNASTTTTIIIENEWSALQQKQLEEYKFIFQSIKKISKNYGCK